MSVRLPVVGGDDGNWGALLNEFLLIEHNSDGTLKIRSDGTLSNLSSALQPGTTIPGGDLSGTYGNPTVSKLRGVAINASAPSNGQVLAYDTASSQWVPSTVSGGTVNDATTGSKGIVQLSGDFGGTASSPTVTGTHLSSALPVNQGGTGSTSQNFVDLSTTQTVAGAKTFSTSISTPSLQVTGGVPATGKVLTSDISGNAAWGSLPSSLPPSGTAGGDLSGSYPNPVLGSTANVASIISSNGTVTSKAPLASPAFTGTPTAPTATAGTNTTQIATTAFVTTAVSGATVNDATTGSKGIVQLTNDLGGTATAPTVTSTHLSSALPVNQGGTGSTSQNFVDLTTNQTVGGIKTFSSTIVGSISGNAATVTTNANLTGDVTSVGNATTVTAVRNIAISNTAPTGGGQVLTSTGTSAASWQTPSSGFADPTSTKGDLIVHGSGSTTRLGVGSNGQVLTADSSQTNGLAWESITGGTLATVTNQQGQPLVLGANGALSWGYPWQFNVMAYGAKGDGSTDDTSAIQTTINTAVTWAQSNGGYCEVIIPPTTTYYAINGALQQGGSTLGNAQIALPVIDTDTTTTNMKVTLVIKGVENATGQFHWKQTVPQRTGTTLVSNGIFGSALLQSNSISGNGHPVVIGGPTQKNGYGTSALKFSNMLVVIKGINIVTPLSTTGLNYGAMDFTGVAQAQIIDSQWGQNTTYANTWINAGNTSTLSTGLSIGLMMPAAGNNDNNLIRNCVVAGGFQRGVILTEHTVIERLAVLYCYTSLSIVGASYLVSPPGALHAVVGDQISAEGYHTLLEVLGSGQGGIGPIMDLHIDTEGTPVFAGTGFSTALGTIYMAGSVPGSFTVPTTSLKIVQEYRSIGPVTTPTFTLGAAFLNPFWHDAFVQIAGGTVTAIKQGATLGGTAAPTMNDTHLTSGMFLVPAGGWLEIDGTVTPSVNNWTLI